MSDLKLAKYLSNKIKTWAIYPILEKMMHSEDNILICYINTKPYNDTKYNLKNDVTICLVKPILFHYAITQNEIFLLCSKSADGIYNESIKASAYVISYFTPCVVGSNKIKLGDKLRYPINKSLPQPHYISIDWNTGLPNDKNCETCKPKILKLLSEYKQADIIEDSKCVHYPIQACLCRVHYPIQACLCRVHYPIQACLCRIQIVEPLKEINSNVPSNNKKIYDLVTYNLSDLINDKILSIIQADELFINYLI